VSTVLLRRGRRCARPFAGVAKTGSTKVVVDLRGTAGGSLDEAVAVANLFVKDGTLAQTSGREGRALKTFTADSNLRFSQDPSLH